MDLTRAPAAAKLGRRCLRAARYARAFLRPRESCRVCGHDTSRRFAYARIFNQCTACDFIFAVTYDRRASADGMGLGGSWSGPGGGGYREYYLASKLIAELGARSVLLYGTGNTPTFGRLREAGIDVIGCDISAEVVTLKRNRYGAETFFTPAELPARRLFDVIIAVEVIEHFVEPRAALNSLFESLGAGGVLCGTTNFWPGGAIEDDNRPGYMSHQEHVAYWCEKSLGQLARAYGLQLSAHEMVRPGSVLPDRHFGQLWPNKRVFFIFKEHVHGDYFKQLHAQQPILPIDQP